MEELMWAAKNDILTAEQFEILEKRSLGWTYKSIVSHFKLSGDHAVITCLTRTVQRKFWYPDFTGGNDDYLCDFDKLYFRNLITNCANEVNCLPTTVSVQLSYLLQKGDVKRL